jgi:osmoprotectant transport system permease protein
MAPMRRYDGRRVAAGWGVTTAAAVAYALLVLNMGFWERWLSWLFPEESSVLYRDGVPLAQFVVEHLVMVAVAGSLIILVGCGLGVFATRPAGQDFRPLVDSFVDVAQTFPPLAVLAIAVPLLGFGFWPTIIALVLYGLFPVVSNTIAGIESVPHSVLESARGMGMSSLQMLVRVELPLAARVILAGVRIAVVITIGTATIGAAVGAGGLGDPIIGGLVTRNVAYVVEGALPAALLAIIVDAYLANVEYLVAAPRGRG